MDCIHLETWLRLEVSEASTMEPVITREMQTTQKLTMQIDGI